MNDRIRYSKQGDNVIVISDTINFSVKPNPKVLLPEMQYKGKLRYAVDAPITKRDKPRDQERAEQRRIKKLKRKGISHVL